MANTYALTKVTALTSADIFRVTLDPDNAAVAETERGVTYATLASNIGGWPQTTLEAANNITPTDTSYEPGNVLRYGAVIDGVTDDTVAFQTAVDSGHPAFCDTPGTTHIQDTIVLDGDKQLTLCADLNVERQSGASTAPVIHIYGQNNVLNGNKADIRQDLYAHTKGIVLVGPDPAESAGGTTDVDTYRNVVRDIKIIGPKQTIAQDGSPGLYIHSLKRKAGSYTKSNYYSQFSGIHIVNCDVGLEFSTDANAHSIHELFINQWQASAITMNGSYGNTMYGVKLETPLSISGTGTTVRYAINLLAKNGSTIESGSDASYDIDAAFENELYGYAELPQATDKYVALMTHTETGTNFGGNVLRFTGQHVSGIGTLGASTDAAIGTTNDVRTPAINIHNRGIVRHKGYDFRTMDDGTGTSMSKDSWAVITGRKASMAEGTNYNLFVVDNVGGSGSSLDATLMIKFTWSSKEDANAASTCGEVWWMCQVEANTANAAIKLFDVQANGGETASITPAITEAAGTTTNTGKYTVSLVTNTVQGTGNTFCGWKAELISSELAYTNLDWDADVTFLATTY